MPVKPQDIVSLPGFNPGLLHRSYLSWWDWIIIWIWVEVNFYVHRFTFYDQHIQGCRNCADFAFSQRPHLYSHPAIDRSTAPSGVWAFRRLWKALMGYSQGNEKCSTNGHFWWKLHIYNLKHYHRRKSHTHIYRECIFYAQKDMGFLKFPSTTNEGLWCGLETAAMMTKAKHHCASPISIHHFYTVVNINQRCLNNLDENSSMSFV